MSRNRTAASQRPGSPAQAWRGARPDQWWCAPAWPLATSDALQLALHRQLLLSQVTDQRLDPTLDLGAAVQCVPDIALMRYVGRDRGTCVSDRALAITHERGACAPVGAGW